MIINHNMSAAFSSRISNLNAANVQSNMEKLSSGMRINSAKDDASGLAVSEKMRSQIRGLNMASKNVQDANSFINTAEGYMQETTDVLQRIRELAVQSGNGVYSSEDRMQIQVEVSQLVSEVDRIASSAQFNGMHILTGRFAAPNQDGTGGTGITFAIGANMDEHITAYIGNMSASSLGLKSDSGIVNLGALQNRTEMAKKGIDIAAENMQSAESRIRDTDMAKEAVDLAKNNILSESSMALLAQANNRNQDVLSLLR